MNPNDNRLIQSAFWLIRLRWFGVPGIVFVTFLSTKVFKISVESVSIYMLSIIFLAINAIFFVMLKKHAQKGDLSQRFINRSINVQISTDLLILTLLLHYSGGVENPFIIYYIFHMIIGSIILSFRESFIQTTFALFLIGMLSIFEYSGIIQHFRLEGFVDHDLYKNEIYLIATGFIFITTSYLVVYITSLLASRAKRNEEAYMRANIELNKRDSLKNEYVLRLTHDIKGHLGAIQSCLIVAVGKMNDPDKTTLEEFMNRALNRTNVLIKFVRDLLHLTKMKLENRMEENAFSIKESVMNVLENVKVHATEKGVDIVTHIEEGVNEMSGRQLSVEELISNLLMNAVTYSRKNSTVHFIVREEDSYIQMEVKDSGIGIPEDEKQGVFNEFTRASNAKRANIAGTGMGLSIARQIVKNHGGEIWFESQESIGTTFFVKLPR